MYIERLMTVGTKKCTFGASNVELLIVEPLRASVTLSGKVADDDTTKL